MKHTKRAILMFAVFAIAAVSVACSSSTTEPSATAEQTQPTATQVDATSTQAATQTDGQSQTTPTDTVTSPDPITPADSIDAVPMTVLFPADGETLGTDVVRVLVAASLDSQVDINGEIATAKVDGTFYSDLVLDDGLNFIEITSINSDGTVENEQLVVFADFTSDSAALSIVSPEDGAITSAASIEITGIASLDSTIYVNGIVTNPDSSGIFQVTVELEDGPNLIEIISINLSGVSVTEELAIFSIPE